MFKNYTLSVALFHFVEIAALGALFVGFNAVFLVSLFAFPGGLGDLINKFCSCQEEWRSSSLTRVELNFERMNRKEREESAKGTGKTPNSKYSRHFKYS